MIEYSILVVDDEELIRKSLSFDLGQGGYSVSLAESGDKAIELLKNYEYDLIITDLKMEGAGGIEVLRSAKEKNKESMVMILTGYGSIDTGVEPGHGRWIDMNTYLAKRANVGMSHGYCTECGEEAKKEINNWKLEN